MKISTLENVVITNNRRDGNSTRQIDKAIQILFNGDTCIVRDHHEGGTNIDANKKLYEHIIDRFFQEHKRNCDFDLDNDFVKLEVKLKKRKE